MKTEFIFEVLQKYVSLDNFNFAKIESDEIVSQKNYFIIIMSLYCRDLIRAVNFSFGYTQYGLLK